MNIKNIEDFINLRMSSKNEAEAKELTNKMAYITHFLHNRGSEYERYYKNGEAYLKEILGIEIVSDEIINSFVNNKRFQTKGQEKFSFIDLFAGIGGFRLAMQEYGGKCVFSSEFNSAAQKTYTLNYGEVPFGDITKQETKDIIPDNFDILCGGFPCQAFSIAGNQKGFEDTRGTLFFDIAEILKTHKPKAAYLENVRNLQGHDSGKTFQVIYNTLENLGYHVFYKVLNACEYANIPQTRERILIVAFNKEKVPQYNNFEFPVPIKLTKTIHDCIDNNKQQEKYYYRKDHIYYERLTEGMKSQDTLYQWRRVYVRENKSNLCPTLTANMGGGGHNVPLILTDEGIRKLTPKECLNFMGYPEEFNFPESISESAKYMQAGNSVVVPMMTRVAEQIIKVLQNC